MRTKIIGLGIIVLFAGCMSTSDRSPSSPPPLPPVVPMVSPGTQIQLTANKIYDTAGVQIIARGPEFVVAENNPGLIDNIAATGANAMRMLLTLDEVNGMTPSSFEAMLARAVSHKMLVWVSLYTWNSAADYLIGSELGGGNFYSLTAPGGTGTCSTATPTPCYLAVWDRQWLKDLMSKYRANVIIDAGQEFIGTSLPDTEAGRSEWADAAKAGIEFFRSDGYTNPLEFMANYQGRDLYGIIQHGADIRAADIISLDGYPQTMFGWQAYWHDLWYQQSYQGPLLLGAGQSITGTQAIQQFAAAQNFPIQIGLDNYGGDTSTDYVSEMDQCATDGISWLWWSWNGGAGSVDCPVSGASCQAYVITSQNGFANARPLTK